MKNKNLLILILFIVSFDCINLINTVTKDTMSRFMSDIDSDNVSISVSNYEKEISAENMNSALHTLENDYKIN